MIITQKIEIKPTKEQKEQFKKNFGYRRWCWNNGLALWNKQYEEYKLAKSKGDLTSDELKKLYPTGWTMRDKLKADKPT